MSEMATRLNLEELPNNTQEMKLKELSEETGGDVKVCLVLPDGAAETRVFKMGTLVCCLKAYVEQTYGYCMKNQVLSLDDSQLLDPLCLSDIPSIKESGTNFIKVDCVVI